MFISDRKYMRINFVVRNKKHIYFTGHSSHGDGDDDILSSLCWPYPMYSIGGLIKGWIDAYKLR